MRSAPRSRSCRSRWMPPTPTSRPPPSGSPSWRPSWQACGRKRRSSGNASCRWTTAWPSWRERLGDARAHAGGDAGASSHAAAAGIRAASRSRRSAATVRRSTPAWSELRAERDALAAHDPIQLRADLEAAEAARTLAEQAMLKADDAALAASTARDAAAEAERAAARGRGRGQPRVARGLHRARPAPRDVRGRGPPPRRHRAAHLRRRAPHPRGAPREPEEALAELTEDDTVESLEKKSRAGAAPAGADRPRQPARDR